VALSHLDSLTYATAYVKSIDAQTHVVVEAFLYYCGDMKNITVSLDEEIYRRARIKAAERDTSVSALVKGFLVELASEEPGSRALEREERELRARIRSFSAGNRLSRDDAHGRDR
jgi:hypothetical protein